MTTKLLIALLLTNTLSCFALDVTVGYDDCIGTCANYIKAGNDAYYAIQTAFNRVRTAGKGKVTLQAGEYIVSTNLNMYSNTAFVGKGVDKTIIKLQNFAAPWKVGTLKRSGLLRAVFKNEQKCENVYVANMTLNGNKLQQNTDADSKYGRYGLFTEGCTNVYVDSLRVEKFQGYGFDPHGWKSAPGGPLYGKNLTIVNSIANDNDWDGFTLDQHNGIYMKNNTAYNNGRHGFNVVTGSFNVYIAEAYTSYNGYYYYEGTTGCGITIQNNQQYGTKGVSLVKSTLAYDNKGGVCTNDVFDVDILNVAVVTRRECFYFVDSRNFVVKNNLCNHTKIFRESNVQNITKVNNTVGMPGNTSNLKYSVHLSATSTDVATKDNILGNNMCASGVFSSQVCCLASCGTCGGTQCSSRVGGAEGCCQTQILGSKRSCNDFEPPCIL